MTLPNDGRNGDFAPGAANYGALSPLSFLLRSAEVFPDKIALIDGDSRVSYRSLLARCRQMASALAQNGIGAGSVVSVIAPNSQQMIESHFAIPLAGAVLNTINTRLDASSVAFIINHAEAAALIVDWEFIPLLAQALPEIRKLPLIIAVKRDADDALPSIAAIDYESFLGSGDASHAGVPVDDEWRSIALNYTSGTTGNPKGVLYHHRGAYLAALGHVIYSRLSNATRYLWIVPLFHCNGWMYCWGVVAVGGSFVCLRRVDPAAIFSLIQKHDITHMGCAPVVLNALIHAPEESKPRLGRRVEVLTGGAPPPSAVLAGMESMGFHITHMYGLTETHGSILVCDWQEEWDELDLAERSRKLARQGVGFVTHNEVTVADPQTLEAVPWDGKTIGEILFRGNLVMKGYLKNPAATGEAFAGGWFHSGDLAVRNADGYIQVRDRSKDIIISGGENISSLEIEEVLFRHPKVLEAAVVAQADEKWGEVPCAFVTLKASAGEVQGAELIAWCREHMAHYKAPKRIIFQELPKNSTGKIQKFALRQSVAAAGIIPA
jgi:fatty-acyl-CoA synthase